MKAFNLLGKLNFAIGRLNIFIHPIIKFLNPPVALTKDALVFERRRDRKFFEISHNFMDAFFPALVDIECVIENELFGVKFPFCFVRGLKFERGEDFPFGSDDGIIEVLIGVSIFDFDGLFLKFMDDLLIHCSEGFFVAEAFFGGTLRRR